MNKENYHRILRRQIKSLVPNEEKLPEWAIKLFDAVNKAYADYDNDLAHLENILRESSKELFVKNNELKRFWEESEEKVKIRTTELEQTSAYLNKAESIAQMGSFTWSLNDNKLVLSEQLKRMINVTDGSSLNVAHLLNKFENSDTIITILKSSIAQKKPFTIPAVKLKDKEKYYFIEGVLNTNAKEVVSLSGILRDISFEELTRLKEEKIEKLYSAVLEISARLMQLRHFNINQEINFTLRTLGDVAGCDRIHLFAVDEKLDIFSNTFEWFKPGLKAELNHLQNIPFKIINRWKRRFLNNEHIYFPRVADIDEEFSEERAKLLENGVVSGLYIPVHYGSKFIGFAGLDTLTPHEAWPEDFIALLKLAINITMSSIYRLNNELEIDQTRRFYETILSEIPNDIAVFDAEHRYLFVNAVGIKDENLRKWIIGKTDFDYCEYRHIDTSLAIKRQTMFNQLKTSKQSITFEDIKRLANGKKSYTLRKFCPVYNENGDLQYAIGYGVDITSIRENEEKLASSLEEKEALLGEIHHRVKNNLALVLGLIEMQSNFGTNPTIGKEFTEVRNRISAMSLIHDKLYKSSSFAKIDLADYLSDLITSIAKFYSKEREVKIVLNLISIFVNNKNAVPLALLVNEVVTNAFKYAFTGKTNGILSVLMSNQNNLVRIVIRDNGPGISDDALVKNNQTLGFKLFNIFVKQLKGSFNYYNDHGLVFEITFTNSD